MFKRDVVISRLDKLNEYIKYLNSVKNIDKDKYLKIVYAIWPPLETY